jgi:peptide chain release factor 3
MQVLYPIAGRREPIVGCVGPLQLEVVAARLQDEYNVACDIESLPYKMARWRVGDDPKIAAMASSTSGTRLTSDRGGRPVMLFASEWALDYATRNNPAVKFIAVHD